MKIKTFLLFALVSLWLPSAEAAPQRVVTVGGAITEAVYAIGGGRLLVGSDTTSYYPPAAAGLPKVGYMRALSVEGILSLRPDLVIMSEESGPPTAIQQLKLAGIDILPLKAARRMADVKEHVTELGKALGREQTAAALNEQITKRGRILAKAIASQKTRPRVMFILNHGGGSPMVAGSGTAAESVIEMSGGINVADYRGYKPLTPEAAAALNPDFILITKRGLERIGGEQSLLRLPGLALTEAAKNRNLIVMDALLLLGFGPRTPEAAAELNSAYKAAQFH